MLSISSKSPRPDQSRLFRVVSLLILSTLTAACGPNLDAINNKLREQTIQQDRQIQSLKSDLANRDATIHDLQARLQGNLPPLQTLPPERLAQLLTASKLEIRPQSETWDSGDGKGISGFRIFVRTLTDENQIIPATGTLTLEAFELPPSPEPPRRLGSWTFTPEEMKKNWYGSLGLNHFALNCSWTSPPKLSEITFKARFQDALTGQTLEAQLTKKVTLPVATAATKP